MLTTIDDRIKARHCVELKGEKSRSRDSLSKALDSVLRHYNAAGFQITSIDGDKEFEPFRNNLKDTLDIDVNIRAGRDKQPEAERNNQVIGERCRTMFHNMPYKKIPKTVIIEMGKLAAEQLNYFPVKRGVS